MQAGLGARQKGVYFLKIVFLMLSLSELPDALRAHIASFFPNAYTFTIYQQCCKCARESNYWIETWKAVLETECFQRHGIKNVWVLFHSILGKVDMSAIRRIYAGIYKAPEIEMILKYYEAITTSQLDNILEIGVDCIPSLTMTKYADPDGDAILWFKNVAYFFVRTQSEMEKSKVMQIGLLYTKSPCVFKGNQVIYHYISDPVYLLSVMDILSKPISVVNARDGFVANQNWTSRYDYSNQFKALLNSPNYII